MSNAESHSEFSATMVGQPDPLIGTTIDGRYLVERVLGEGGMGLVYRARHVVLNKLIAVKVLRAEVSNDAVVIERFRQEAQSATAIGNQHIIDVLDFGRLPDGATYFVMEFLNGSALTDVIEREAPLAIARFVHVARQLCDALGAAHNAGIVHRDLKPDNVFLVKRGQDPDFVKVLDFGIAKVGGTSSKLTQAGQVFGTPHYMAPEQCQGKSVDLRADVYALGVILFELATGQLPFHSESLVGLLTAHMLETPPAPTSLRPDLPPEIETIILRCLAKNPDDRFADCAAMAADLDAFAAGLPVAHAPRVSGIVEASRASRSSAPSGATSMPPPALAPSSAASNGGLFLALAAALGIGALVGAGFIGYELMVTKRTPAQSPPAAVSVSPTASAAAANPPLGAPAAPVAAGSAAAISPTIRIVSEPSTAEVTSNGEFLGNTPLEIPRPTGAERRELVVSLGGFTTRMVTISASTLGAELRFALQRDAQGSSHAGGRSTAHGGTSSGSDSAMRAPTAPPSSSSSSPNPPNDSTPRRRHSSEVINPWGN